MKIRFLIPLLFITLMATTEEVVVTAVEKVRSADITSIKAITADDLLLITQGAGLLKSTDGGIKFDRVPSLSNQTLYNNNLFSVLIDGTYIYLGGGSKNFVFSPGFHASSDGGSTFNYYGLEGININDIIKYNGKILLAPRGSGVLFFENEVLSAFNAGIEQANVSKLYWDEVNTGSLVAGADNYLAKYNMSNQTWDSTSLKQAIIDIVKGANNNAYLAGLDKLFETTDFINFNPLPDLDPGNFFNYKTIAYFEPYLYAGILPYNYESNIPLVWRLNTNTNIWEPDTSGTGKNPGIPQDFEIFGNHMWLATAAGFFDKFTTSDHWNESAERLTAANLTKISYNELNNSIWLGGTQGDVKVAYDINGEWFNNDWGLTLGVQVNDITHTSYGNFVIQYSGVFFQENIGDKFERRMNGLSSNGYTSIGYNPNNNTLVLVSFNDLYNSTDGGIQWQHISSGYFDQVGYSKRLDKFFVSNLNNLLSSDGTGQNFEVFAADVQSLDFVIKDNSDNTKIGVAEAEDFKEIDENGNITSIGYNGMQIGTFAEKVGFSLSLNTWVAKYENVVSVYNSVDDIWEIYEVTDNFITDMNFNIQYDGGSTNKFNSVTSDLNLIATLGGGLYANASAVGINDNENITLKNFHLEQNYPNPFNPSTKIRFTIPSNLRGETKEVTLIIYDVLGNKVATLVDENKPAGEYEVEFSANDIPASGIYFYQLRADSFVQTRKMVLLR